MSEEKRGSDADGSTELGPLPSGRHGFSSEQVAHNQRERLLAALVEAVTEHGYAATTVGHITEAASVSRRVFYKNFDDKEACFLVAFDIVIEHLRRVMRDAATTEADWPHAVIAALRAMLGFLAAHPDLARLCMVETVTASPAVAEHFREVLLGFVPLLEPGRAERSNTRELPASAEDSLLGGLASLIARSILAGRAEQLGELLPDLVDFVLAPYLGPDEARRLARKAAE